MTVEGSREGLWRVLHLRHHNSNSTIPIHCMLRESVVRCGDLIDFTKVAEITNHLSVFGVQA